MRWFQHLLCLLVCACGTARHGPSEPGIAVVGVGLPNTGIRTLRDSLELLGYKVAGMEVFDSNPALRASWRQWWHSRTPPEFVFQNLTDAGYTAVVGEPFSLAYEYIMLRNPDSLFVLTLRNDSKGWYSSVRQAVAPWRRFHWHWWLASDYEEQHSFRHEFFDRLGCNVMDTPGLPRTQDWCINAHQRHITAVRETVKDNRLLDWDVRKGWGPLCALLGVAVPARIPFPTRSRARAEDITWIMVFIIPVLPFLYACWHCGLCPFFEGQTDDSDDFEHQPRVPQRRPSATSPAGVKLKRQ